MILNILTPERKIFEGEVYGLIVPGVSGYFELLENHAPIVAALGKGNMKVLKEKTGKASEEYIITGGFIEMSNNKTVVLVEDAETIK
jgi:F-type H+-transporting ATPase subunit epsilon